MQTLLVRRSIPLVFLRSSRYRANIVFPNPIRLFTSKLDTMNAQELANFLADTPPSVVNLEIAKHFEALSDKQKRYSHFISK